MSAECKRCGPNLNHFSINHFAKQIIQLYQCHVRINISEFCNFTISARTGTHIHTHTVWHTGRVHFIRLYRISVESFAEPTLHAVQFFPRQLWWRCALQRITRKKEKKRIWNKHTMIVVVVTFCSSFRLKNVRNLSCSCEREVN